MSPERTNDILAKIDAAIGPPEAETEAESEARHRMIDRDRERRLDNCRSAA